MLRADRERGVSNASCITYGTESTGPYSAAQQDYRGSSWFSLGKATREDGAPTADQMRKRPVWQPDECCPMCCDIRCKQKFSMWTRRHHCRGCGFIFCAKHSSASVPIEDMGYDQPARVCEFCNALLSLEEHAVKPQSLHDRASTHLFRSKRRSLKRDSTSSPGATDSPPRRYTSP